MTATVEVAGPFKVESKPYTIALEPPTIRKAGRKLVARWKLDEAQGDSATDSSGNNLVGKLVGNPQWQLTGGKFGGALEFDGDGDYVQIEDESAFDITGEITVSVWIKVNAFDKNWQAIVTKGDSAWRLQRDRARNGIEFACTRLQVAGPGEGNIIGTANINDGEWHHLCGTHDGEDIRLYVDSVEDAASPVAYSGGIGTNDQPVCIGENAQYTGREWNGLIDDVRIYDYALNQDEVAAVFADKELGKIGKRRNWIPVLVIVFVLVTVAVLVARRKTQ